MTTVRTPAIHWLFAATLSVLIGEGLMHVMYDIPYRAVLWNEEWLSSILAGLGIQWRQWLEEIVPDARLIHWQHGMSIFLLVIAALLVAQWLLPQKLRWVGRWYILTGLYLLFIAVMHWSNQFGYPVEFFEYSLRMGSPLLLWGALRQKQSADQLRLWAKAFLALTFASHGLYAMGVYPIPASFREMTFNIMGWEGETAEQFLFIAGVLDLLVAVFIWLPNRIARWALMYAVIWGLLTTLARLIAYLPLGNDEVWTSLQTIVRLPHVLIPAWLWWVTTRHTDNSRLRSST